MLFFFHSSSLSPVLQWELMRALRFREPRRVFFKADHAVFKLIDIGL